MAAKVSTFLVKEYKKNKYSIEYGKHSSYSML